MEGGRADDRASGAMPGSDRSPQLETVGREGARRLLRCPRPTPCPLLAPLSTDGKVASLHGELALPAPPSRPQSVRRRQRPRASGAPRFFLLAPDEVRRPSPADVGPPSPTDLIDDVATFARYAPPSWVGADGLPRSWRHWVYGSAWIAREFTRGQLRDAQAQRMAGLAKADWESWQRDIDMVTGVPRISAHG